MANKSGRVSPRLSAYIYLMHNKIGVPIRQLARDIPEYSLTTIFRHAKKNLHNMSVPPKYNDHSMPKIIKPGRGRPRKVRDRDEPNIIRVLKKLREKDGACTSKKVQVEAGLKHISNRTVRDVLNRNGYSYLQARRKGLMSTQDLQRRTKYARKMIGEHSDNVWKQDICFYLDGSSFIHKTNPADQARAPMAKVWRTKNEGVKRGCTAKGDKAGSGGKAAHFMACISYLYFPIPYLDRVILVLVRTGGGGGFRPPPQITHEVVMVSP